MESCKITLSSAESEIVVFGEMALTANGFKLFYKLDGDGCEAAYESGIFTQTRSGSFNMTVRFCENADSECVIKEGGLSGAIGVFTKKLSADIKSNGVAVYINYELGGEQKTLKLTAEFQEKK